VPTPRARVTTIFILIALVAGGSFLFAFFRFKRSPVAPGADALFAQAQGGDERAVRELIEKLEGEPGHDTEAMLAHMLTNDQALVRAAACTAIGRGHQLPFAGAIWPRLSDDDWRVRAAGFEALHDLAGDNVRFDTPLRDTPVEEREQTIVSAMSQWRAQRDRLTPLPQLCELYPTLDHWLVGPVLLEQCLTCHAPSHETYQSSTRCMSCHQQVHKTWFASAHSRSISHLPLAKVDPVSKKVVLVQYGMREGLDCLTCHREATATSSAANVSSIAPPLAPSHHRFDRSVPAAQSCATCHSETQQQWETWQSRPRPRMASWPPGAIEWTSQSPAPSCIECHMRALQTPGDKSLPHSFTARRNVELLIGGLSARIEPATHDRPPRLVVTNFAGHSYPAGTHRRSLRIEVQYDEDPATRTLLARLKQRDPVPTTQPYAEVLGPGEERSFDLAIRPGAKTVSCDVTYERNAYVDVGYEVNLAHVTQRLPE
jgi:hypothetical protein